MSVKSLLKKVVNETYLYVVLMLLSIACVPFVAYASMCAYAEGKYIMFGGCIVSSLTLIGFIIILIRMIRLVIIMHDQGYVVVKK